MDPHDFVAEVYRRLSLRHPVENRGPTWSEIENDVMVKAAFDDYAAYLPADRNAPILDIGFGGGWFLAACLKLGYRNLCGADFEIRNRAYVRDWAPDRIGLYEIQSNIGDFLRDQKQQYDFIHLYHVIERIPKYSLFWVVDGLYWALKRNGTVLLRTPNMEGPCPASSFYVTLAHEYGFAGSNLVSLLDMCGFDDVRILSFREHAWTLKQRVGGLLRWPMVKQNQFRHRLFGGNTSSVFGAELIVTGRRGDWPPYFDPRYK